MSIKAANRKDLLGGALILVLGLATAFQATRYDIGSLRRMGPGFFPLALGVILMVTGMLIIAASRRAVTGPAAVRLPPEWRGWICICAAIAAFIVMGRYGGLLPATFAIVFISALGDRHNSLRTAVLLALSMTLICLVVFWWLLQLRLPLFGWG
jgi:hypothetical protein